MRSQTFELLTPCFCAGASKEIPEMRTPSIRGHVRYWTRILFGAGKTEYDLFGGVKGKHHDYADDAVASAVALHVNDKREWQSAEASLILHKQDRGQPDMKYITACIPAGSQFDLNWQPRQHPDFRYKFTDDEKGKLVTVLRCWLLLGTIGRRSTRAAGSVWPVDYSPTLDAFDNAVQQLHLPGTVRVAVLGRTEPSRESAEELRAIAGETVHGLEKDQLSGNPLGYAVRRERKASPLRFKIGRFIDGYRIIAIADNRDQRGGSIREAILNMLQGPPNSKRLGNWLESSILVNPAGMH